MLPRRVPIRIRESMPIRNNRRKTSVRSGRAPIPTNNPTPKCFRNRSLPNNRLSRKDENFCPLSESKFFRKSCVAPNVRKDEVLRRKPDSLSCRDCKHNRRHSSRHSNRHRSHRNNRCRRNIRNLCHSLFVNILRRKSSARLQTP